MNAASKMLQQLRTSYLNELPSRLNEIEQVMMALEKSGFVEETFNSLFRLVHSLKGSGGTYRLHEITNICHPLEDLLGEFPEKREHFNKVSIDTVLGYIDLLRDVVDDFSFNDECHIDIETRLQDLRRKTFPAMRSALIVERSSAIIGFLSECLKEQNMRVEVANDGYAALGRLLAEPFDYLITSMEVQRLNGAAIIAALRLAQGSNIRTKTILLTTNALSIPSAIKPSFIVLKDAQLHRRISAILSMNV
jgi:chemotaxis protein histidine kinase CheA